MKTSILVRLSLVLFLLLLSPLTHAQTRPTAAARPGYWNVETNLTTRDYTIVRFYNGQDQLVYEESLPNLCIDLAPRKGICRRTTRQLNKTLEQLLRDPAAAGQTTTLLAQQFGQNRRVQRVYAVR